MTKIFKNNGPILVYDRCDCAVAYCAGVWRFVAAAVYHLDIIDVEFRIKV